METNKFLEALGPKSAPITLVSKIPIKYANEVKETDPVTKNRACQNRWLPLSMANDPELHENSSEVKDNFYYEQHQEEELRREI